MNDKERNRAAIYARYSGDPNCSSESRQVEACRKFAGILGLEIVDEYVDAQQSVRQKRPEFERMLIDAKTGRFDIVVAEDLDRITRDVATAAMLNTILGVPLTIVSDYDAERRAFDRASGSGETPPSRRRQESARSRDAVRYFRKVGTGLCLQVEREAEDRASRRSRDPADARHRVRCGCRFPNHRETSERARGGIRARAASTGRRQLSVTETAESSIAAAMVATRTEMNHAFGNKPGATRGITIRQQRTILLIHATYAFGAEPATIAKSLNRIEETRKLNQRLWQTT